MSALKRYHEYCQLIWMRVRRVASGLSPCACPISRSLFSSAHPDAHPTTSQSVYHSFALSALATHHPATTKLARGRAGRQTLMRTENSTPSLRALGIDLGGSGMGAPCCWDGKGCTGEWAGHGDRRGDVGDPKLDPPSSLASQPFEGGLGRVRCITGVPWDALARRRTLGTAGCEMRGEPWLARLEQFRMARPNWRGILWAAGSLGERRRCRRSAAADPLVPLHSGPRCSEEDQEVGRQHQRASRACHQVGQVLAWVQVDPQGDALGQGCVSQPPPPPFLPSG